MKKLGLAVGMILLVVGCSRYTSNAEEQYLQSRNGVDLVVPPPLSSTNISEFYRLPQATKNTRVSIIPPRVSQTTAP